MSPGKDIIITQTGIGVTAQDYHHDIEIMIFIIHIK
jgi:hypothetical protein